MARQWVEDLLRGGLPAVLDYGSAGGNAQGDTRPEQTPPDQTARDTEPGFSFQNAIMGVTQEQILGITAGAVGVIGLIWLVRNL